MSTTMFGVFEDLLDPTNIKEILSESYEEKKDFL